MELHRIGGLVGELIGRIDDIFRRSNHLCPFREGRYAVSVRHPHLRLAAHAFEQRGFRRHTEQGAPVFTGIRSLHAAPEMVGQVLGAITNAQQRQMPLDGRYIHLRGIGLTDGTGAAGKDDALHGSIQRRNLVIRIDFAKNIKLPEAPANELGHLRAKVQNENFIHVRELFRNLRIIFKIIAKFACCMVGPPLPYLNN